MLNLAILLVSTLLAVGTPHPQESESPTAFAQRHAGKDQQLSLDQMRAALAELELRVAVQRDLAGTARRLEALRTASLKTLEADPTNPAALDAAVLALQAWIEIGLAQGNAAKVAELLATDPATVAPAARASWTALLTDDRVLTWRDYVAAVQSGTATSPPFAALLIRPTQADNELDEAIRRALVMGDGLFLQELGKRAAPTLVRAVTEDLESSSKYNVDPLLVLSRADPETATATMLTHYDRGGLLWRIRILRTLSQMMPSWFLQGRPPVVDRLPGQQELWLRLVRDPDLATEALEKLPSAHRGDFSEALLGAVVEALASEDSERRDAAAKCLFKDWASPVNVPLAEAALSSPHADVRLAAATILNKTPWSDTLAARFDDPYNRVRLAVAQLLGKRRLEWYDENWNSNRESFAPVLDVERLAILRKLLLDQDRDVRLAAAELLPNWPTTTVSVELPAGGSGTPETVTVRRILAPPSAQELTTLAQDPSEDVRKNLIELAGSLAPEDGLAVLRVLASAEDADIAWQALRSIPATWYRSHPTEVLEIVRAYRHWYEPTLENMPRLHGLANKIVRPAAVTPAGLEAIYRWAVAERGWVLEVVYALDGAPRLAKELSPTTYATYLAILDEQSQEVRNEDLVGWLLSMPEERMIPVYEEIAGDAKRSTHVRALASLALGRWRAEGWQSTLLEALHDPFWGPQPVDARVRFTRLESGFEHLPTERANALGLELVRDRDAQLHSVDTLLAMAPLDGPGGEQLALAIRERWSTQDPEHAGYRAISHVIESMAYVPVLRDDEYLTLAVGDASYATPVVDTIGKLRDPAHLPLLQRVLDEHRGTNLWGRMVREVLPSFLTDESAEMLLQAASLASNEQTREACLQNLERMRTYFLARDYWAERKQLRDTRTVAVAELLELLDSDKEAVRVHAVRGLATFRAVEAIPRLIRLLEDPAPAVAAAAADSLDRLNEPEPTRELEDDPDRGAPK